LRFGSTHYMEVLAMKRLTVIGLLGASLMLLVGPIGSAGAATTPRPLSTIASALPVKGEALQGVGDFRGRYRIRQFGVENGNLVAVGRLTGVLTQGNTQRTVRQSGVVMPVDISPVGALVAQVTSCRILTLTLGPLDLNLLGLRVQLNQINLRVTGQRGPGNLLGNLLCSLAGLLDQQAVATSRF
jgi:hypothetical protein